MLVADHCFIASLRKFQYLVNLVGFVRYTIQAYSLSDYTSITTHKLKPSIYTQITHFLKNIAMDSCSFQAGLDVDSLFSWVGYLTFHDWTGVFRALQSANMYIAPPPPSSRSSPSVGSRIRSFLTQPLAWLALVRLKGKVYPCGSPPPKSQSCYWREINDSDPSSMAVCEQDGQVEALH